MIIDNSLSEADNITALIKEANPDTFTYPVNTLTFSELAIGEEGYNSSVLATAKPTAPFAGTNRYSYNRLDLSGDGVNSNLTSPITVTAEETEAEITARVIALGNIISSSVTINYIPPTENSQGSFEIEANEGSLVYLPSFLAIPVDMEEEFEEPEPETELPEWVTSTTTTVEPLSAEESTPEGMMFAGSNEPTSDMTVVSNGELVLSTSARIHQSQTTVAPNEGIYSISVNETQDWNFPLAIMLKYNPPGTLITDLYDVTFAMRSVDKSTEVLLDLQHDGTSYTFVNYALSLNINNNTVFLDDHGIQNIQRVRFYGQELGLTEFNPFGSALGMFELELTATRKVGDTPVLINTILVEVTEDPPV